MGLHAFQSEPAHCAMYRAVLPPADLPSLFGFEDGWNIPGARHRRDLPGVRFDGVDHYVLTVHIGGATVRRIDDPRFGAVARSGALSLQAPGSAGAFRSQGLVNYGHLYFSQGLLCEVGEAIGIGDRAEVGDFFARSDRDCARAAIAYVERGEDGYDPPTAIEMDSRGYLIALALLRASAGRQAVPASDRTPVRHDLRRALALIDERIDERLRLSDLAASVGLSPFHFARVFRASLGETPANYLMRRRTERAVDMIRATALPLGEIAFRTGFSSQAHMTRRVKALTGHSPGQLRTGRGDAEARAPKQG